MIESNYLKVLFYSYLKNNDKLFQSVNFLGKKYNFIWDYVNQQNAWICDSLWKKLGFLNHESDDLNWKNILEFPENVKWKLDQLSIDTVFETLIYFKNTEGNLVETKVELLCLFEEDKLSKVIGYFDKDDFSIGNESTFLLEKKDKFDFISENISDGIYVVENDKLVFASSVYLNMIGFTLEEKLANYEKNKFHLIHPDDLEYVRNSIYNAAELKKSSTKYTYRCRHKDGHYIWREDIMNIHYNETGYPFRAVTITRDVTKEKQEEIEEASRLNQVKYQNEILVNLYSNVIEGDLNKKIDYVVELAAKGLNIDRASFWVLKKDHLECESLYDSNGFMTTIVPNLNVRDIPKYLASFSNQNALIADDVYDNEHTSDLIDYYLKPLQITDLLDIPVRENGKLFGLLCCEHRQDERVWKEYEITFARAIADYIHLILEEDKRKKIEIDLTENQKMFQFLSENTSDGIVVFEGGVVSYVSLAFEKLSGYSQEFVLGKNADQIFDFVHPDDLPRLKETIYESIEKKLSKISYEYRFKGTNNEYYWREDAATILYKDDGTYSKYIILSRDITNRKNTEQELIESERQLRLITENTSDGVAVIEEGKLTYVSPSFLKLLGYKKEDYKVFTMQDIFANMHPDDVEGVIKTVYGNLAQQKSEFKYEHRFKGNDGIFYWREDSANVIYDKETGKYTKYIVVTRDISKRKEEEKERNRLHRITEKQNEKLVNFTHIVSHDIRSHTSNLSMILDLFEDTTNPEEQKEYFSMLKQSTNKLSDTIYYLNETVSIQSGIKNERSKLNLFTKIQNSIIGINAIIKSSNAKIIKNVPKDIEIIGTQSYIESIVFNLLTNAIKYKHPDRNPVIKIDAVRVGEEVILTISDNGIGIDLSKNKEKLFGMYKTFHGNEDAVGLGLFMVKNHIESMGGRIEVESEVNKGTSFKIYFI